MAKKKSRYTYLIKFSPDKNLNYSKLGVPN